MILQPISIAVAIGILVMIANTAQVASSSLSKTERWERMPISTNIEDRR